MYKRQAKSTAVVFFRLRRLSPRLYVGDTPLPQSPGVKHLEVHLDRRPTWRTHSKQVARKTTNRLNQLRSCLQKINDSANNTREISKDKAKQEAYIALKALTYFPSKWIHLILKIRLDIHHNIRVYICQGLSK